ncbi:hypothetical protein SAMN05444503_10283 [Pseudomonas sp. BS3767]|uniref:Uncharacterized protein n=1 Tax=Pseudomonas syringae TaxID=317 RepID=A0AB37ZET3_PSESX|nr:hypothetical protein SAMN05444503_10283 [Pseudomonas sp. BS3767]SDL92516.1 hypothetical protein SAMN05444505_10184 [Pseudomonas syringae]SDM23415.1 hypothetical protein SAMN05444502_10183 [Pseudomonas sp. BS3759]
MRAHCPSSPIRPSAKEQCNLMELRRKLNAAFLASHFVLKYELQFNDKASVRR